MTKKALVIDDSRAMRTILSGILGELGYEVEGAEDGGQALLILNSGGPFDLALVDWNMPQMTGYDFVCEVREEPRFADLRLVMVTTENEISRMSEALEAGADEYIMKPFNKEMLLEKLMLLGIEADRD
ncbi:MAG: response regulator [Acidobacteria bacterium]|nr:response regulator [Acidobacteriota bacterium]